MKYMDFVLSRIIHSIPNCKICRAHKPQMPRERLLHTAAALPPGVRRV